MKEEINSLSIQYTKLSNDAEVALASERVALDQLEALERSVHEKTKKLVSLEKAYEKLDVEHQVIKGAYNILEKKGEQVTIDPLLFLETQWAKDRHEFYTQTTALQSQISDLSAENHSLKEKIKEWGPDKVEVANMAKELSELKKKVKTLKSEDRIKEGKCCAWESQVLKLVC